MQFITLLNAFVHVCTCDSMPLLKGPVLLTKSHHLHFHCLESPLIYLTYAYEKHSCSPPGFCTKLSGMASGRGNNVVPKLHVVTIPFNFQYPFSIKRNFQLSFKLEEEI